MGKRADGTLERIYQHDLVTCFRSIGTLVLNLHGHMMQAPGWPDLYVAHWKWAGWLELKTEKDEPTTLQAQVIRDLKRRGVPAFVARLRGATEVIEDECGSELIFGWGGSALERLQALRSLGLGRL